MCRSTRLFLGVPSLVHSFMQSKMGVENDDVPRIHPSIEKFSAWKYTTDHHHRRKLNRQSYSTPTHILHRIYIYLCIPFRAVEFCCAPTSTTTALQSSPRGYVTSQIILGNKITYYYSVTIADRSLADSKLFVLQFECPPFALRGSNS